MLVKPGVYLTELNSDSDENCYLQIPLLIEFV